MVEVAEEAPAVLVILLGTAVLPLLEATTCVPLTQRTDSVAVLMAVLVTCHKRVAEPKTVELLL